MKKHSRALTLISLLIGAALFAYWIRAADPFEILARIRSLGAGFLLILLISGLRPALRAWAWRRCLSEEDQGIGLLPLWRARLSGDALGNVTTAGPLVAEPVRLISLGNELPLSSAVSSLTVETLIYTISSGLLVAAGALTLLAVFAVGGRLRAVSIAALFLMLALAVAAALVIGGRWKLLSRLGAIARRRLQGTRLWDRLGLSIRHLLELENFVYDFFARRPRDFFLVASAEIGFHLFSAAETWATLWLTGAAPSLFAVFILEATGRAINMFFAFVPAKVGVDEAGSGLLSATLGMGAASGVTLALVRKARVLFWTAAGLIFLAGKRRQVTG